MATTERPLRRREWIELAILGVPTFAFALAITTVSTYLPVLASSFASSTTVIGALIGLEGLMAIALPIVVGSWSDRLATPLGGRLPFVLGATPTLVLALALLGFVGSIGAAAFALAIFFASYFVAYEPYRALYPDLVGEEVAGRAQSTQAIARGIGTRPGSGRRRRPHRIGQAGPVRRQRRGGGDQHRRVRLGCRSSRHPALGGLQRRRDAHTAAPARRAGARAP